jgi:hypothetical protein
VTRRHITGFVHHRNQRRKKIQPIIAMGPRRRRWLGMKTRCNSTAQTILWISQTSSLNFDPSKNDFGSALG